MNKSVVLFTFKFPYGGQESFLETELPVLASELEDINIVPLFSEKTKRSVAYKNVKVFSSILGRRSPMIFLQLLNPLVWLNIKDWRPRHLKKMLKQAIIMHALKRYLKEHKELLKKDVFYFYWGTNTANGLISLNFNNKTVARFHRFDLYEEDEPGGEPQVLRENLNHKLDKLVFIAEHGKSYYLSKYSNISEKAIVSYLGTKDLGPGKASEDKILRIVTCSNIIPVKRVHLIAEALNRLEDIQIIWTHFGSGPAKEVNRLYKETAELSEKIEFNHMGRRPNKEVLDYLKNQPVDLFLNVSLSEGLPVSIMEAMSFGIPVMATDCGGVSELVLPEYLLPLDLSPELLATRIKAFAKEDFQKPALRENCRELWRKNFHAETNYKNFAKLLREL